MRRDVARFAGALRRDGIAAGDRSRRLRAKLPEAIGRTRLRDRGACVVVVLAGLRVQGCSIASGRSSTALITADGLLLRRRTHDSLARVAEVLKGLPTWSALSWSLCRGPGTRRVPASVTGMTTRYIERGTTVRGAAFDHPLYILYSSGTTVFPSARHGAGGTLDRASQGAAAQRHQAGRPGVLFTTCGWMMWNWLDQRSRPARHWCSTRSRFIRTATFYSTSPTLTGRRCSGHQPNSSTPFRRSLSPRRTHQLTTVRTIRSHASPLAPESFDFVYEHIKPDAPPRIDLRLGPTSSDASRWATRPVGVAR